MTPGQPVLIEPGLLVALVSAFVFAGVWWRCSPRWRVRLAVGLIGLLMLAAIAYLALYVWAIDSMWRD